MGAHQAFGLEVLHLGEEGVVVAFEIEQQDRLVHLLQLVGNHRLGDLVEGAYSAREGDEGMAVG